MKFLGPKIDGLLANSKLLLAVMNMQIPAWWAKFMSVSQKCIPLMNGGILNDVLNWVWQNMRYENVEYKIWKCASARFLSRFVELRFLTQLVNQRGPDQLLSKRDKSASSTTYNIVSLTNKNNYIQEICVLSVSIGEPWARQSTYYITLISEKRRKYQLLRPPNTTLVRE